MDLDCDLRDSRTLQCEIESLNSTLFAALRFSWLYMRNEAFFFAGRAKRHISRPAAAGLTFPLTVLKFRSHPENPSCSQGNDSNRWDLRSFEPAAGYVGAVVTEKNGCEIRFWDWQFYSPSYY